VIDFDFDLVFLGRKSLYILVHFICTLLMNVPGNRQFKLMPD